MLRRKEGGGGVVRDIPHLVVHGVGHSRLQEGNRKISMMQ